MEGVPSAETCAAAIRILALYHKAPDRSPFVDEILQKMVAVAPHDPAWKKQLETFEPYMKAGSAEPR